MKYCKHCDTTKPFSEFYKIRVKRKDGSIRESYRSMCQTCDKARKSKRDRRTSKERAEQHLLKKYKMTPASHKALLESQGNRCAICGTTEPGGRYNKFHVDHCHETGKVRGLLCHRCNYALGYFQDNPQNLQNAIQYLERSKQLELS